MKRLVVLLLALCMVFTLAACGNKTKCDICGETKVCKTVEILGEKGNICRDCEKQLNDLADLVG